MTPPTAEGGALRSQDMRTAGDPTSADGAILRVNPDTGAALPDNPNAGSADPMTRRIVAHGFRNPFRMTVRPGTGEIWAGDVGWNDLGGDRPHRRRRRPRSPTSAGRATRARRGRARYDNLNLNLCESLYTQGAGAHAAPYYTYNHADKVVPGEACPSGASSVVRARVLLRHPFPARYRNGALLRRLLAQLHLVHAGRRQRPAGSRPARDVRLRRRRLVNLPVGPDGALYYPDLNNGAIRRIGYRPRTRLRPRGRPPHPTSGAAPLTVQFDGSASSDPERRRAHLRVGPRRRRRSTTTRPLPHPRAPTRPAPSRSGCASAIPADCPAPTARRSPPAARRRRASTLRPRARPGRSATGSASPAARRTPPAPPCPPPP